MAHEAGKGDRRRQGDNKAFESNYDRIFVDHEHRELDERQESQYSFESWVLYHGYNVAPENHEAEYHKWLEWRLKVDRGETRIAPMIVADIQPYVSMIDGSIISSRNHHREHLKQHGKIEIAGEEKYIQRQAESKKQEMKKKRREQIIDIVTNNKRPKPH